jgi:hypothetical protein
MASLPVSQGKLSVAQQTSLLDRFGTKPVNVAALRGGVLQAKPPGQRQIGVDWVPPMAALSLVVPQAVSMGVAQKLQATALPEAFSWRNADDIKKAGKGKPMLQPVRNQLTCGSCWAVSAATVLSHRYSIATQTPIDLSETYLMTCQAGKGQSQECNGGFPLEAGKFFEESGTVSRECYPYTWCANSDACAQQGQGEAAEGSNPLIPACGEQCIKCPAGGPDCEAAPDTEFKLFKAKTGTAKQLVTIEDIKADIYTYGPCVGSYGVYGDFLKEGADNFSKTAGVYINRQTEESPYGDAEAAKQVMGFHAVTIVGWGVQDVPGFGQVPYWEVQNSWGEGWGDKGFWKHAMTDASQDINVKVGMDIPADFEVGQGQTQKIGGGTTFLPDTEYVPTQGGNNNGDGSNGDPNNNSNGGNDGGNGGGNGAPRKSAGWLSPSSIVGYILILCTLALIITLVMYARRC